MSEPTTNPRVRVAGALLALAAMLLTGRLVTQSGLTGRAGGDPPPGCNEGSYEALPDDQVVEGDLLVPDLVGQADGDYQDVLEGQYVVVLAQDEAPDFVRLPNGIVRTGEAALDLELEQLAFVRPVVKIRDDRYTRRRLDSAVVIQSSEPPDEIVARIEAYDNVQYIEPVMRVHALATPTDPYYPYQWHLDMMDVGTAHDRSDGTGATVAVMDTGVAMGGSDGVNGLTHGYNCIDDNTDANDVHGHGTHVAGTIAQSTNNGRGAAGVAPGADILAYKVLGDDGSGTSVALAECIYKAVEDGANILNMSLGMGGSSSLVEDALDHAEENGVTVVAATGNDGLSDGVAFPASYGTVLAVGAVDAAAEVTGYSNQGSEIDIVAPGGDVGADLDSDGYGDGVLQQTVSDGAWTWSFFQGTSMATPHVAGAAALLYADGITVPEDIRAALTETAEDLGAPGHDTVYGHGLVDVNAALDWTPEEVLPPLEITKIYSVRKSAQWFKVVVVTNRPTTTQYRVAGVNYTDDRSLAWRSKWFNDTVNRWVRITVTDEHGNWTRQWLKVGQD